MIPDYFRAGLYRLGTAYINSHRRVKLQSTSAGSCFGVAVDDADFLAKLIYENDDTV